MEHEVKVTMAKSYSEIKSDSVIHFRKHHMSMR